MSSSSTETVVEVTMPKMGISVSEGTIVEWRKRPGDWVEADETIAEVTTDKIDVDHVIVRADADPVIGLGEQAAEIELCDLPRSRRCHVRDDDCRVRVVRGGQSLRHPRT